MGKLLSCLGVDEWLVSRCVALFTCKDEPPGITIPVEVKGAGVSTCVWRTALYKADTNDAQTQAVLSRSVRCIVPWLLVQQSAKRTGLLLTRSTTRVLVVGQLLGFKTRDSTICSWCSEHLRAAFSAVVFRMNNGCTLGGCVETVSE